MSRRPVRSCTSPGSAATSVTATSGWSAVKRSRSVRRELQIVFQNPDSSLNPRHTVFETIRRPIRLFRDDVRRADERKTVVELLEAVKLPREVLHRYPVELSGGQKQRVALGRAFAARPSVLLCDEVTSALDVSVQATIIELIAELSAGFGTAVVIVSHDLAVVRTIATRALVMRNGEVCEEGDTERLFVAPGHPYTRELLAAIPSVVWGFIGITLMNSLIISLTGASVGVNVLNAGIILALMSVPIMVSIGEDALKAFTTPASDTVPRKAQAAAIRRFNSKLRRQERLLTRIAHEQLALGGV